MRVLDLIEFLPGPTMFLETKFASIVSRLETSAGYIFQSFRHKQALFYFTFTQIKMFVLFFASLFPIFPVDEIKDMAIKIIPWMFFAVSLVIAMTQFFGTPYVSILHNIVNGFGYFVGGIAAMIAALAVSGSDISPKVGDTFLILIFLCQPIIALLVPLFARGDPNLMPTAYHLEDVLERDRWLTRAFKKKRDKAKNLVVEASSSESEEERRKEREQRKKAYADAVKQREKKKKERKKRREPDPSNEEELLDFDPKFSVEEFTVTKYAPIHVQKGMNKKAPGMKYARDVWGILPVIKEADVHEATLEMFDMANKLLDAVSFNRLVLLLDISVIFVSACLGWGVGAGTALWKKSCSEDLAISSEYYLRCNMDANGTFPPWIPLPPP
jgi:hypothetical protein